MSVGRFSATFTAALILSLLATPLSAQTSAYRAPRLKGTAQPDLNGIWQALSTANWDIQDHVAEPSPLFQLGAIGARPGGQGVVEGNEIPYRPEAAAKKKKENYEKRMSNTAFDGPGDPELKCYMPGIPRATYMPHPFQIVQSDKFILVAYQYANANREIRFDNPGPNPVDTWMGRSIGKWDGDTLVVETTGLNGKAWLDRAGNFVSESARVVERFTPMTPYHLNYEVTIEDPTVFTRPWKMSMPLYRRLEKNVQLSEFNCVEFTEELVYGHLRKKD